MHQKFQRPTYDVGGRIDLCTYELRSLASTDKILDRFNTDDGLSNDNW